MITAINYGKLDLYPETKLWDIPLPAGDQGIAVTIAMMQMAAAGLPPLWLGQKNPQIRQLALSIVSGVANNDSAGERAAVYQWVKGNIHFRGELDETVQTPEVTLKFAAGDCDDFSVLIAALLGSIGVQWEFRTVATGAKGNDFTHVYPVILDNQSGEWVALDATVSQAYPGWEPRRITRSKTWDASKDMKGMRFLGQDDSGADQVSEVIDAATPLITGTIYAAQGLPASYYAPPPAYSVNPQQLPPMLQQPAVPLTQRSWFWPSLLALGAFALYKDGESRGLKR